MNIPRYWAKGLTRHDVRMRSPFTDKQMGPLSCWGWSNTSVKEARERGSKRADAVAEMILKGNRPDHYLYGDRPMREEIVDEWKRGNKTTYAAVTLNAYGCQVLNTASTMFIDVDLPMASGWELFKHRVSGLFGKNGPSPQERNEADALAKVQSMVKADNRFGIRAYRTRAGLRYLITHSHADPTSEITFNIMEVLGADPLYIRLCKVQECFRARLTPKPWRCGSHALPVGFPWKDDKEEQKARAWIDAYTNKAKGFATCSLINHYGSTTMDEEISRIVSFHDTFTKALSGLDLA